MRSRDGSVSGIAASATAGDYSSVTPDGAASLNTSPGKSDQIHKIIENIFFMKTNNCFTSKFVLNFHVIMQIRNLELCLESKRFRYKSIIL